MEDAGQPGQAEMARRVREFDWSGTVLGPRQDWPQSLVTTLSVVLNSRFPMFLFWGPEAICLYNDAYRPSLGQDMHPRALGSRGQDLWAEIWDIIGPQIADVMATGAQTWHENQLVPFDRNGYLEEIYFTYSYSPVHEESGAVGGTLVVCAETTDQVISNRRLTTLLGLSNLKPGTTAEAASQVKAVLAAATTDLPFTALYEVPTGGAARQVALTGLPAEASLLPTSVVPDAGGQLWLARALAAPTRTVHELDPGLDLPDGVWPEPCRQVVASPVSPAGSDAAGLVLVAGLSPRKRLDVAYTGFLDLLVAGVAAVFEHARTRESERRRVEAMAALDRAKTAFFSNVSHEFRTPLTLLLGPLEDLLAQYDEKAARSGSPLLDPGPDPDQAVQQLGKAHRNASRLLRLVNSLLDISQLDAQQGVAQVTPTDLPALTTTLVSAFGTAADQAGLRLTLDSPPAGPVLVDRQIWEKVVLNLVSNALKYTTRGEIRVRLRHEDGTAVLTVADTGVGIPADGLDRIFDRFYRSEHPEARSIEGSGIGLALVSELVALHGGRIEVASTVGAGSTFTVRIPAPSAPWTDAGGRPAQGALASLDDDTNLVPEARLLAAEAHRWTGPVAAGPAVAPGDKPPVLPPGSAKVARVLVVDDNADMRSHVTRLLGRHWRVDTALDGAEALDLIRTSPPDLVLSDVMMPRLDGVGLLRAIRSDPGLATIPVILLSARAGQEAAVDGLDAGADDYVVKPFSATELISRVRTNLNAAHLRTERTRAAQELAARDRQIALRLQEAMLGTPDHVDTLETATRYLPATDGLHVGGDWHDVITLPDGRVGLVIGDVVGHNLDAAAAMGQLRSAVRTLAPLIHDPADLLTHLDPFARQTPGAHYATITYLILDPATGQLHHTSAGHPPPLIATPHGTSAYLADGRHPPLGVHGSFRRETAVTTLHPGQLLVLYTDGLVERRSESLTAGLDRLTEAVTALDPRTTCAQACDHIVQHLTEDQPGVVDDVALMVIRRATRPEGEARVPAGPTSTE